MDVVGNSDFLDVIHVFGCCKQYLDFTWMLWVMSFFLSDFLDVIHVFGCCKQYLDFTWMLWIIMTSFFLCIWLVKTIFRFYMDVMDNNDFLDVSMYLVVEKQYLDFTQIWLL